MTALAAAMMTFVATTSVAQQANLAVRATITPAGGCVPQVQDVDFGVITGEVLPGGNIAVQKRTSLRVVCSVATKFAFRITDLTDSATLSGPQYFGLGKQADGHKLGQYIILTLGDELVGQSLLMMSRLDGNDAWGTPYSQSSSVRQDTLYGLTNGYLGAYEPDPFTVVDVPLELRATIYGDGLDLTQDTPIQGEATIELVFL
jgi:hypothetical protein